MKTITLLFLFSFVTACSDSEDIKQTKSQDITPADCINVEVIKDNRTATHLQKECSKLAIKESRYEKSSGKKWSID